MCPLLHKVYKLWRFIRGQFLFTQRKLMKKIILCLPISKLNTSLTSMYKCLNLQSLLGQSEKVFMVLEHLGKADGYKWITLFS